MSNSQSLEEALDEIQLDPERPVVKRQDQILIFLQQGISLSEHNSVSIRVYIETAFDTPSGLSHVARMQRNRTWRNKFKELCPNIDLRITAGSYNHIIDLCRRTAPWRTDGQTFPDIEELDRALTLLGEIFAEQHKEDNHTAINLVWYVTYARGWSAFNIQLRAS